MNIRNKKLLLILIALMLFVSIGKETYALFTSEVSSIVQSYSTGTLKLSYSNASINLNNVYPMSDTDGMNSNETTITITNVGTLTYKFNVILEPTSNSTLDSRFIKVSMDGENPAILFSDSNIIIRDVILNPGSFRTFTIKLWIPNIVSSSDILGKKFNANLTSSGIAVKDVEDSDGTVLIGGESLYDYIKNNADTTTQIDFSQTSEQSNTNGIYITTNTDSGKPVYYYRGAVDNNVLFANFCWKIIRTTETGGIKLIYNGKILNGGCVFFDEDDIYYEDSYFNLNYDDAKYVGYMYGASIDDTANTNNSTIKTTIDTWYQNNMTSYTSQLEDTVFCNDRSYTASDSNLYFGAYTRLVANKQPTLKCKSAKDKFTVDASNGNGDLRYPVGLITADEVAYAGGVYFSSNNSFYLYNIFDKSSSWSMTPAENLSGSAGAFFIGGDGALHDFTLRSSYLALPVISLKPDMEYSSGNGTSSSPFVISS